MGEKKKAKKKAVKVAKKLHPNLLLFAGHLQKLLETNDGLHGNDADFYVEENGEELVNKLYDVVRALDNGESHDNDDILKHNTNELLMTAFKLYVSHIGLHQ